MLGFEMISLAKKLFEKKQTPESESKEYHEVEEIQEGIFDINKIDEGFPGIWRKKIVEYKCEGKVIDIKERELSYDCGAYQKPREILGSSFSLETSKGKGNVYFPRQFSLTDINAIRGQRIKYLCQKRSGAEDYDADNTYRIEILTGSLKGENIKKKVGGYDINSFLNQN